LHPARIVPRRGQPLGFVRFGEAELPIDLEVKAKNGHRGSCAAETAGLFGFRTKTTLARVASDRHLKNGLGLVVGDRRCLLYRSSSVTGTRDVVRVKQTAA
jgi:hypothetical protein